MAVYTSVSRAEAAALAAAFGLGILRDMQGISEGVENSNFRLHCEKADAILTLYEVIPRQDLSYFHGLLKRHHQAGICVAPPLRSETGATVVTVQDKPAALFPLLTGKHLDTPRSQHCAAVGRSLAKMHLAASNYPHRKAWDLDAPSLKTLIERLLPNLPIEQQQRLKAALKQAQKCPYDTLPSGTIHGDLFRDNVLFEGDSVSGILDFSTAHHSVLLYDLAVAAIDWCSTEDGHFDPVRSDALLAGYAELRPLHKQETHHWHDMLRSAALRFWLSRLRDWHFPRSGVLITAKDPSPLAQLYQNIK